MILDISEYRKILEELEELKSIKAYDITKQSGDEVLPFELAIWKLKKSKDEL